MFKGLCVRLLWLCLCELVKHGNTVLGLLDTSVFEDKDNHIYCLKGPPFK